MVNPIAFPEFMKSDHLSIPPPAQPGSADVATPAAKEPEAPKLQPVNAVGKWRNSKVTGVQRFAREVDEQIKNAFEFQYNERFYNSHGRLGGVLLSQLLPWWHRSVAAYGPCNIGVAFKKRQLVVVHDTAVYDVPDSYRKGFILYYKIMFRITLPFARAIGTVSEFSKRQLEHHFPCTKGKVHVVGNGVSPFWFEGERGSKSPFLLLVSSMDPKKNFPALVKAWLELRKEHPRELSGWGLKIVGEKNAKIFQEGANDIADETIEWMGRVSDEELRTLYSRAGGFVFPSKYEGFGLPPLEAMAAGAPVATSNAASLPEVGGQEFDWEKSPDGCVFYFSPEDELEMKQAVLKLVCLPDSHREKMTANARKRAATFTWKNVGERVSGILKNLQDS